MFEWDKSKDIENKSKHGISFADTFAVFEDPNGVTLRIFGNTSNAISPLEWMPLAAYW